MQIFHSPGKCVNISLTRKMCKYFTHQESMQILQSAGECANTSLTSKICKYFNQPENANISIHRFDSAVPSVLVQKMYFAASDLISTECSHVDWFFIKEGQKMVDSSLYLIYSPHTSGLVHGTTDPDARHKMAAPMVLFSSH